MDQKISACSRHLLRNEWVIDNIDQVPIEALSRNIQKARMLRGLRPLRPRGTSLGLDGDRCLKGAPEPNRQCACQHYNAKTFHRVCPPLGRLLSRWKLRRVKKLGRKL